MTKFKIGDLVETPLGIGTLKDISQNNETKYKVIYSGFYGSKSTWYAHDEIKFYVSAHNKLLNLGFKVNETIDGHFIQYEDKERDMQVLFNLITKECGVFHSLDTNYRFMNLELSHIITQYLKEFENEIK
jgi:hypothetical protein